jgi:hypothetical protein
VRPTQARFGISFRQAAPALLTWIIVLSGISILFKYLVIQEVYYDGFLVAFDVLFERQERLVGVFLLPVIFSRDVLECFLIVSGLFLLCRHLFRRDFNFLLLIALPLLLILAGANYISFRELRTGLTVDNLTITAAWAMVDPDILKPYFLKRNFIMAATVVLWSFYPYFLIKYRNAHNKGTKRYLALACLAWVIPVIVALGLFSLANLALARHWWWAMALVILAVICASCLFHGTRSTVRKSNDQPSIAWVAALLALAVASLGYTVAGSAMLATPPFYISGHWTMIGTSLLQQGCSTLST